MKTSVTIINIPYTSLLISTVYSDSPCQNTFESKYNKIRNIIKLYTLNNAGLFEAKFG